MKIPDVKIPNPFTHFESSVKGVMVASGLNLLYEVAISITGKNVVPGVVAMVCAGTTFYVLNRKYPAAITSSDPEKRRSVIGGFCFGVAPLGALPITVSNTVQNQVDNLKSTICSVVDCGDEPFGNLRGSKILPGLPRVHNASRALGRHIS